MRIVQINMMHTGSTGKIMFGIADSARRDGNIVKTFSPIYYIRHGKMIKQEIAEHVYFGFSRENMLHYATARLFGLENYGSVRGTLQLIRKLKAYQPDIVHLHNLHNYTINLPLLFSYLKKEDLRVIWTLHDCWAFTGRCSYFTMCECQKWITGCGHCPQIHSYPRYLSDQTGRIWKMKQRLFADMQNMVIVTPSQWLSDLAHRSMLNPCSLYTIPNGIDLTIFSPMRSAFREKYHIDRKRLLLGVAFDWDVRKGLDVFVKLADLLDRSYQIILVGTNEDIDAQLPKSIISIHRTQDQKELAEIYSAADVFVNPTREDNFPTVNMEALACGTPVITFDTGGSPEIIDETCGIVVPCDDIPALEKAIHHVVEDQPFTAEACRRRAEKFDMQDKFAEYVQLYHDLYEKK